LRKQSRLWYTRLSLRRSSVSLGLQNPEWRNGQVRSWHREATSEDPSDDEEQTEAPKRARSRRVSVARSQIHSRTLSIQLGNTTHAPATARVRAHMSRMCARMLACAWAHRVWISCMCACEYYLRACVRICRATCLQQRAAARQQEAQLHKHCLESSTATCGGSCCCCIGGVWICAFGSAERECQQTTSSNQQTSLTSVSGEQCGRHRRFERPLREPATAPP